MLSGYLKERVLDTGVSIKKAKFADRTKQGIHITLSHDKEIDECVIDGAIDHAEKDGFGVIYLHDYLELV